MWFLGDVHGPAVNGLARAASEAEAEQAVRGIDSHKEIALQGIVAEAIRGAGFGVHREVRYPGDRARPKRSEGRRCDLVVTRDALPLDEESVQPSLFSSPRASSIAEALWVEIKVVPQFLEGRPNRGYGSALQGPVWRDFKKLAADPAVENAAQLLVLFTATDEIAEHDLAATLDAASRRGLLFDTPVAARLPIGDRLGNAVCTICMVQVRR